MKKTLLLLTALLVSIGWTRAAIINISLDGTQETNTWLPLNSANYPGSGSFPGTTLWSPYASTTGGAELAKVANGAAGGPYFASGSIYFGSFGSVTNTYGGTLALVDDTPQLNLQTVVFQVEIGEAWTFDFHNHEAPILSLDYSGGTAELAADYSQLIEQVDNGTVEMPSGTETVYINTWGFQWDLSAYTGITGYSVSFTGVEHAQVYNVRLDASDTFTQVVPEPSTYLMLGLGLAGLTWLRRRNQRRRTVH